MSTRATRFGNGWLVAGLLALAPAPAGYAYPPAPDHTVFGLVRDESGNPLRNATIILEAASGVQISGQVVPTIDAGVNYQLTIPMDAGITDDAYRATALRPMAPFRIKVQVGQNIYLPIEMKADYSQLGQPGKRTRIDLNLGQDANGDGIPDAWEKAMLASAGLATDLTNVRAGDHIAGSAMSLLQLYVAGVYTFDPKDGFSLKIVRDGASSSVLEFLAVRGRSYTVYGSADLQTWNRVAFQAPPGAANASPQSYYYATSTQVIQVEVTKPGDGTAFSFYKLMVQ